MGNCCGKSKDAIKLDECIADAPTPEHLLRVMGETPLDELLPESKHEYKLVGPAKEIYEGLPDTCGCLGRICCGLFCVLLVLIALLLASGSPPLPSGVTEEGVKPDSKVVFLNSEDLAAAIPRPPASYPESLQGVLWMDQWGYYGHTDLSAGSEDGVMSFGDVNFDSLNKDTHDIYVSTGGPAWTWLNNPDAYSEYDSMARYGSYLFQFNEDYTEARVWQSLHANGRNWFGIGPTLSFLKTLFLQFYMMRQSPPPGSCPPAADATKEERSVCATWRRETCVLWCFGSWLGFNKAAVYYVFQVVDEKGKKVQPYFTEFQNLAYARAAPDAEEAAAHNITLGKAGHSHDAVFLGKTV